MRDERVDFTVENGEEPNTKRVQAKFTLDVDNALIERADLGRSRQTCKICGASGDFQTYRLIEMQYGTGDPFTYFECAECGTLQIESFPENIGKYYADDYYSYTPPDIQPVRPGAVLDTRMILDVGCGMGEWLCNLAAIGCVNLFGCDPFIERSVTYSNGVKIYKKSIHEMTERFDVITFHDSFEHMSDPREVFKTLARILKNSGEQSGPEAPKIELALPVHPSVTFDIYGPYAFPLDPPRHFFLYSDKAIRRLAEQHGFYVESKVDRPIWGHLPISRYYQKGLPWKTFSETFFVSPEYYRDPQAAQAMYEALAQCAALVGRSDHAYYTLKRKG